jgi:hypothetical protein
MDADSLCTQHGKHIARVSAELVERKGVFSGFPTVEDSEIAESDSRTQAAYTVKAIYDQGLQVV